jgi:hypothetical protein
LHNENPEDTMKSKLLAIFSTLVLTLGLLAQNATQTAPAANGSGAKACAGCDQAKTADGKPACTAKDKACCGKEGSCCGSEAALASKDGKAANACPMMSKDGKMSCCADGKCPMMAKDKGKGCCGGKCARTTASSNAQPDCCLQGGMCCSKAAACCKPGVVATHHSCCGHAPATA